MAEKVLKMKKYTAIKKNALECLKRGNTAATKKRTFEKLVMLCSTTTNTTPRMASNKYLTRSITCECEQPQ